MKKGTQEKTKILKAVKVLLNAEKPEDIDATTFDYLINLQTLIKKMGCKMIG
jgi:hypothetical protein